MRWCSEGLLLVGRHTLMRSRWKLLSKPKSQQTHQLQRVPMRVPHEKLWTQPSSLSALGFLAACSDTSVLLSFLTNYKRLPLILGHLTVIATDTFGRPSLFVTPFLPGPTPSRVYSNTRLKARMRLLSFKLPLTSASSSGAVTATSSSCARHLRASLSASAYSIYSSSQVPASA